MERSSLMLWKVGLLVLALIETSSATLSPTGINYEVVALMAIKTDLIDPHNVLENWDINSVDPCSWRMVTCSADGHVSALGLPSQSLSGTLSPKIGDLTNLQYLLLQNNAISGPIPTTIGKLEKLQKLDLSNNTFSGEIPSVSAAGPQEPELSVLHYEDKEETDRCRGRRCSDPRFNKGCNNYHCF